MARSIKIGVVGSRSFLAQHFISHLQASCDAYEVICFDRPHYDLTSASPFEDATALCGLDFIANFAAISVPIHDDYREIYESNAFGQLKLLEALERGGFRGRLLFVSSGYVYAADQGVCDELDTPAPANHYGVSKLNAELYCRWKASILDVVVARPFNCVGEGQSSKFLVPKLVKSFAKKDAVLEMGNIDIERDFVDARDAASMFELALLKGVRNGIYNIANGRAISIATLLDTLGSLAGHAPEIRIVEKYQRQNDVLFQCGANNAIAGLGYEQTYSIENTLSWMLNSFST